MNKYTLLIFFFSSLLFTACGDDDKGKNNRDRPETLAWIEDTMREVYLWNTEIPQETKLDLTLDTRDFFYSLLSRKDGRDLRDGSHFYYSTIEELTENTRSSIQETTYGFEFTLVTDRSDNNKIKAMVLFVLPNSPAEEAGLKRGDWIIEMNGKSISSYEMAQRLYGDVAQTFTVAEFNVTEGNYENEKSIKIGAAVKMENNPILISKVITKGDKKIGYLLYNSFDDGKKEGEKATPYDDELRTLTSTKFNEVNEFVLDLRYNNGGLLSCVQLLSAILAPQKDLDKRLGYMIYNDKREESFNMDRNRLNPGGKNLNLQRVYILVQKTSASASEAMINLLRPYMDVVVVGQTTEGKNVGSQYRDNKDKTWRLHPITCYIANDKGFYDYANGIVPDYIKGDVFDYHDDGSVSRVDDIYPLGNPNERLLKIALDLIEGRNGNNSRSMPVYNDWCIEGPNSLQRKATHSVMVDTRK